MRPTIARTIVSLAAFGLPFGWVGCTTSHCTPAAKLPAIRPVHEWDQPGPLRVLVFVPAGGIKEPAQVVFLLHEVNGFTSYTAKFAERLADEGFTVYAPIMFGGPIDDGWWSQFRNSLHVFVGPHWPYLVCNRSPDVLPELRCTLALVRDLHPGDKIGVIGMCMSGTLPIALLSEEQTFVAAVCQPALPGSFTMKLRQDLALSSADLNAGLARIGERQLVIMGFRFESDNLSPSERYQVVACRIRKSGGTFLDKHIPIQEQPRPRHATFTSAYVEGADEPTARRFRELVAEFHRQLAK